MYRRPFLVLPGGECVPLEGEWRVEELRGEWYVLGQNAVTRFESEREALARLAQLRGPVEPNALAAFALESVDAGGDPIPGEIFGEADLH